MVIQIEQKNVLANDHQQFTPLYESNISDEKELVEAQNFSVNRRFNGRLFKEWLLIAGYLLFLIGAGLLIFVYIKNKKAR